MFHPETSQYLLPHLASPLQGWPIQRLYNLGTGFSPGDLHGQLYCFLRDLLEECARRLQSGKRFAFNVTAQDALDTQHLRDVAPFDRIDTAQLADSIQVGLRPLLDKLGPLLKTAQENPHAGFITVFANRWYHVTKDDIGDTKETQMQSVANFLQLTEFGLPVQTSDPQVDLGLSPLRVMAGRIFEPYDHLFTHYMKMVGFEKAGEETGMTMKEGNKIVKKWPLRLFKEFNDHKAKEEYDCLLASKTRGMIRVVEWARKA